MKSANPINYALVEIAKEYEDEISLSGNIRLFIDTSYEKSKHVTCVGKVHALPKNPKTLLERKICQSIKEGDEVCFSFRVVSDIECIPTEGYFTELTHKEEKVIKKWQNSKQENLTKVRTPTRTGGTQWVGVHTNKFGDYIDGIQGNESIVDKWLSAFPLSQEDNYKFKNLIPLDNVDVWKVQLEDIFAKKNEDGTLTPIGERLLLSPIDIDVKKRIEIMKGIILPEQSIINRLYDRATILHDYPALNIEKGDIIAFLPNMVEKYEFYGKEYFVLKPYRILGKWIKKSKIQLADA